MPKAKLKEYDPSVLRMQLQELKEKHPSPRIQAECSHFGICGGCTFQDLPYQDELKLKSSVLREHYIAKLHLDQTLIADAVPSPQDYGVRSKLDLSYRRFRDGTELLGFMPKGEKQVLHIDDCPMAQSQLREGLPTLRLELAKKEIGRTGRASIVYRCGDAPSPQFGGIGRRSLHLHEDQYLYIDIEGVRIHYSLDTFFQANLKILPQLFHALHHYGIFTKESLFCDLYSGVGLFALVAAKTAKKVLMIDENPHSIQMAQYNMQYNKITNAEVITGKVEEQMDALQQSGNNSMTAMIDPPRSGMEDSACHFLAEFQPIKSLAYLSCNPLTHTRDLKIFLDAGWIIQCIQPFDFFPRTHHLESLAILSR